MALVLLATPFTGAQTLSPPPVTILQNDGGLGAGFVFVGPQDFTAPNPVLGPEIIDNLGRPVWFISSGGNQTLDFRVQTYQGNPVLTWSAGNYQNLNPGATTDFIMDSTYTVIAQVQAGNGYNADNHEFQLTPQGTALITINDNVTADLSSLGGPVNGTVLEGTVQEIDVPTGTVLFEWHSLANVPLSESYYAYATGQTASYDYFHINSVKLDTDGNLLISSRHTWTVYKVNRTTGAIIWRLGGKKSDFTLGPGLPFAWQHDAEAVDSQTLRIFDNESDGVPVLPSSRVVWVKHDDTAMAATLVQSIVHPAGLSVSAEGNAQALSNGDTFVDWGILGRVSEFNASGQLLFDASEETGYGSYRGFRYQWTGAPIAAPTAAAYQSAAGPIDVHAIWNGATQVATWEVYGGATAATMSLITSVPWNGLDTMIPVNASLDALQVVALDASGNTIGTSAAISGPFVGEFSSEPTSQTSAAGGAVVFSVTATNPAATYQWLFNGNPLTNGTVGGATISGATSSTLSVSGTTPLNSGSYSCVATSFGNALTSNAATLTVNGGTAAQFSVSAPGTAIEGTAIEVTVTALNALGATAASYSGTVQITSSDGTAVLPGSGTLTNGVGTFQVTLNSPGGQTIIATDSASGSITGTSGSVEVSPASRLINISCRAQVGTGANQLIVGYVVGGQGTSGTEPMLIRASGPALSSFGVTGVLLDPELTLNDAGGVLATNSAWGGNAQIASAATQVGAFSWNSKTSLDSALLESLPAGAYTAQVAGASGDTGVALAEVYDATPAASITSASPRLINFSARDHVGTGGNILIAGFVVGGTTSKTVLIRGSGPALAAFGLSGTLPDPQLQLYQSNASGVSTLMQSNTGWGGNAQIAAAAASAGAFSWGPSATPDSAILVTLPPGVYTAQVSGASGDTGIALVEIYDVR